MIKLWRETSAVAQRILIELVRRWRSLIFWATFPASLLWINSLILADRTPLTQAEALEQTAPGVLVGAALFFSCLGGSVATVVAEREQQTLKRLFISPLSGLAYFLGIFLAHSTIGIGQALLVYTIVLLAGAEFTGSVLLAALIILLSIVAYVGVGFILGTQLARRTDDVNTLVAAFGVPLLLLGGAFIPVDFFPETLLSLSRLNPIYHMNEALAAVSSSEIDWAVANQHLGFLGIFSGVMLVGGWLSYRRMLQVERRL